MQRSEAVLLGNVSLSIGLWVWSSYFLKLDFSNFLLFMILTLYHGNLPSKGSTIVQVCLQACRRILLLINMMARPSSNAGWVNTAVSHIVDQPVIVAWPEMQPYRQGVLLWPVTLLLVVWHHFGVTPVASTIANVGVLLWLSLRLMGPLFIIFFIKVIDIASSLVACTIVKYDWIQTQTNNCILIVISVENTRSLWVEGMWSHYPILIAFPLSVPH